MESQKNTAVTSQNRVRCLFPDTNSKAASVPQSATFSIGDIIKSEGLPVKESVTQSHQWTTLPSLPSTTKTPTDQPPAHHTLPYAPSSIKAEPDQIQARQEEMSHGLRLEHLLHDQPNKFKPSDVNTMQKSYNPFLTFLDRPDLPESSKSCETPVTLSLHHLQNHQHPFLSPLTSWPSSCKQTPSSNSTQSVQDHKWNPRSSLSPTSNASDDQIDVESTSPNGSTDSSGFYSNPSPTPSSISSSSSKSPLDGPTVNHRTSYTEKHVTRLTEVFQANRYPDVDVYEELSQELGIPIQRLKVWFQNRRARSKKNVSDPRMLTCPPNMAAMMSSAPGYGYMPPTPMMHHPLYQYPVSSTKMYPMYHPAMYPGYTYPFHFQH